MMCSHSDGRGGHGDGRDRGAGAASSAAARARGATASFVLRVLLLLCIGCCRTALTAEIGSVLVSVVGQWTTAAVMWP
eukprot:1160175-Pelagomonas_calceolata.AAC.6